jgi:FSR family fosmidomycin resistance protein-like MFS transporter
MESIKSMKRVVTITSIGHFANDGLVLMLPLLIPFIARDFSLSYTQIGFLGGSLVLTMGVGQIFTGYLSDFSSVKWPFISLGLVILSVSLFGMSFCSSYLCLIVCNLLAGVGASFYHPCGVALLAKSMKDNIQGKVLGIHGVGGCAGIVVYPILAGIILDTMGWNHTLLILPPTGLVAALFFFFVKEKKSFLTERKKFQLFNLETVFLIALFGCIAMVFRGFVTFLPVQLEEGGYSAASITTVVTIFYGTGVVGELLAGFLSDMYSKKKILFAALMATSGLMVVLFNAVWVFIIPLGFVCYVVWVPAMAVYVEKVPAAWYGTALGLLQGLAGLMAFMSPMTMGFIAERSGISLSFLFLSGIALAGALLSLKIVPQR